jgi:TPR repeat protein
MNPHLSLVPLAMACLLAASAAPTLAQPQAPPATASRHAGCNVCDAQELLNEGEYDRAMGIFQHLSAEGNPQATSDIGFMYEHGLGRPVDYAKARQWYAKAGELDESMGLSNLGEMYERGLGTRIDYAEAMRLYRRGAAAGDAGAAYQLGRLYQHGLGSPADPVAAMCWYQVAQNNGDDDARPQIETIMAQGNPYPIPPVCHPITGMAG